jgi:nucleotide-binding universal stress UspA family protein
MIKKILLAYDGSPGAQFAAKHAAELARLYDGEVTVLTVGGPLFGATSPDASMTHMSEHDYEKVADEGLAILAEQNVRSHKRFRWVDPADEILQEAREGGYDLIIMSHRSARSCIRRDEGMLGSVAIKVLNHAPCSVMMVRPSPNSNTDERSLGLV